MDGESYDVHPAALYPITSGIMRVSMSLMVHLAPEGSCEDSQNLRTLKSLLLSVEAILIRPGNSRQMLFSKKKIFSLNCFYDLQTGFQSKPGCLDHHLNVI